MDFSEALRAMKNGKRVRRAFWAGTYGSTMEIADLTVPGGQVIRQLIVRHEDGRVFTFGGSQWDILSDDWGLAE